MRDVIPPTRTATLVGVACAMMLAHVTPAIAQRDTTVKDTVERPFVRGGVYDKPYLARLGGRTTIGGYAEAHARWERVDGRRDEAGFEAKRFNLFTNARVSDFVRIGAELEFEDGGSEIKLEYAAIDLRIHPSLTLRGGMFATGRIALAAGGPVPTLPATAVRTEAGQTYVWTISDGKLAKKTVLVGRRDDDAGRVELKTALPANMKVLAAKFDNLKEGAPALVRAPDEAKPKKSS